MNTPTHEEIAQRAQQIWQDYGSPAGRDSEIWLEAERQLMAGKSETNSNSASRETLRTINESEGGGAGALGERIKLGTTTEPAPEHAVPIIIPKEEAAKANVRKKEARAPKVPAKTAPKPAPPESGKPLWNQPHSS